MLSRSPLSASPHWKEREGQRHAALEHHLQKKIARSHAMTKIIFITSPNSHGENGQGPGLTLSQRVRTCVSVNWLHSFNCSIHWSRSFVVALSSIAVVVEEKVSSIFVDSILTAFIITQGCRKISNYCCVRLPTAYSLVYLHTIANRINSIWAIFFVFFVHKRDDDTIYEGKDCPRCDRLPRNA